MNNYLDEYKRRWKSITQRFLLLGVEYQKGQDDIIDCVILGSNNTMYHICISCEPTLAFCCTCPDAMIRKSICKHLYWFGFKKLGKSNPIEWTKDDIAVFLNKYIGGGAIKGRNDSCPICLEHINYEKEGTTCCEGVCNNSVHTICWNRYTDISNNFACVTCRSPLL